MRTEEEIERGGEESESERKRKLAVVSGRREEKFEP